MKLVRELI